MVRQFAQLSLMTILALTSLGCASFPVASSASSSRAAVYRASDAAPEKSDGKEPSNANGSNGDEKNGKEDKPEEPEKPAKTLLEWAVGPKEEKKNGNGTGNGAEEEPLVTDRPDFTEASTTVGRGRIQLEAGYTYTRDRDNGTQQDAHSYPETLWRIGLFADWFELRIGWNYNTQRNATGELEEFFDGADDLYLGVKLALTEQKAYLPETAVILQMTVPTGSDAFSADEVHPGVNFLYSWEVIKDCISLGASTQANRASSAVHVGFPFVPGASDSPLVRHSYVELAQSMTVGYTLTSKLGAFTEWFALFPHGSIDPEVKPEYYCDGGFTYLVTNNFQLDIRAGVGLNGPAQNFFTGAGFSVRY